MKGRGKEREGKGKGRAIPSLTPLSFPSGRGKREGGRGGGMPHLQGDRRPCKASRGLSVTAGLLVLCPSFHSLCSF